MEILAYSHLAPYPHQPLQPAKEASFPLRFERWMLLGSLCGGLTLVSMGIGSFTAIAQVRSERFNLYEVTAPALNIRSTPSLADNRNIIGSHFEGEVVRTTGEVRNGFLALEEGGWVAIDYLQPFDEPPSSDLPPSRDIEGTSARVTASALNVRSSPNEFDPTNIVSILVEEEVVTVTENRNNGFVQLVDGNWVYDAYLEPIPSRAVREVPYIANLGGPVLGNPQNNVPYRFAPLPAPETAYYVAVPGQSSELESLYAGIREVEGIPWRNIFAKASRRGPFMAVGPFADRPSAEAVNKLLLQEGFRNARVHFES